MHFYILYSLLIFARTNIAFSSNPIHPFSDDYIAHINRRQSYWTAGINFAVEEWELFKILASGVVRMLEKPQNLKINIHNENDNVPESFDARIQWPVCGSIGEIRDQSRCRAGWAFAAVEAMSDRICIHSGYGKQVYVSAQDVLTCSDSEGCKGWDPYFAWRHWSGNGIVTGGLYNHPEQGCKSYFLPPCEDHEKECINIVDTPECNKTCDDPSIDYSSELTFGTCADVCQFSNEKQIQIEVYKNGPVEATFDVYEDFGNYKSGIYQRTSNITVGTHAVKIIGWGVQNEVKYWLIVNSWNNQWGDNGLFKIIRGQNECNIEDYVLSGLPDFFKTSN